MKTGPLRDERRNYWSTVLPAFTREIGQTVHSDGFETSAKPVWGQRKLIAAELSSTLSNGTLRYMVTLRPDILVMRAGTPEILLVVEVKNSVIDPKTSESELKSYMVEMSCPVGMIVTPTHVRFYRNRYTDYSPQAVETIGECPTRELLSGLPEGEIRESELERLVQEWLEGLVAGSTRKWPPEIREAIESSVLSVVLDGTVREGGPRRHRAG